MERDKDLDRVKALLSSYYGNDDDGDGPGGGAAATSSRSANEAAHGASGDGALFSERASAASSSFGAGNSLDSTNFEANAFFDNLLETTHLDELLEKEVKLQGEVKTFDGEMQQLVYENYNKFISATDTIRNMRGKVDDMEVKMENVKQSIKKIAVSNSAVDEKMQERRNRFDELNTVREVMGKLTEVFELPNKCRLAVERGSLEVAVRYIVTCKPFLASYSEGVLGEVKRSMEKIQADLIATLKGKVEEDPDNSAEVIHFVRQLGGSVDELEDAFVSSSKTQLEEAVGAAMAALEGCNCMGELEASGDAKDDQASTVVTDFLAALVDDFVPRAIKLQTQYSSMFSVSRNSASDKLGVIVEEIIGDAIRATKKCILIHPVKTLASPAFVLDILTQIKESFEKIQNSFQGYEIQPRILDCIECSLRNYVGSKFLQLEPALKDRMAESISDKSLSPGESGSDMASQLEEVTEKIREIFDTFLEELRDLRARGSKSIRHVFWKESYMGLVEEGCYQTFMSIHDFAGEGAEGLSSHSSIFLSRLLKNFARDLAPHVDKKLSDLFTSGEAAGLGGGRSVVQTFLKLSEKFVDAIQFDSTLSKEEIDFLLEEAADRASARD